MATVKKREAFPLLALRDMVILPHVITHFDAARKKSVAAIERADAGDGYLFLTTQKDPDVEEPEIDDLYEIGTLVKINQILRLPGDIVRVLVEGHARGRIVASDFSDSYIRAQVDVFEEEEVDMDAEMEALLRMAEADLDEYIEKNNKIYPGLLDSVINYDTPQTFADTVAGYVNLRAEDAQSVLDAIDIKARLTTLHMVLSREIELLTIENAIDDKVKRNMSQSQKEYFLKEQMKVIRRELGEGGDEEEEIDNYREKLEEKALPDAVREKAEKELQKLGRMNSASPEYAGITNYLDWVLDLPWCEEAEEDYELAEARKILDDEHYGLKDIKERILEFIALRKKSSNAKSPILCLVGPPGVGKTSIAASVAKALKKPYVRMSLGGMTDESEIRGHRRTYIGSMPGRVLTLMKQAKKNNPLFLLDEIDKVGNDYRGDPASGLLEVLDPAQNNTFTDRYMEVPFDLSKVFFITTANTTKTIPAPLLDRMEIIRLGGYTPEEKREIATRHLWPKHLKDVGYDPEEITISDNAVDTVIESYTGEAGVRMLDKELAKIVRKVTLEYLERDKKRVQITNRNLSKYLGEKKALRDTVEEEDLVGYVNGLAWTSIGGVLLGIEVNIVPGKGKMQLTGQLGDVMKESAQAALSYIWSKGEEIGIPADFKEKHDIHIHVPDGATPKDGPSAGIAMTTALYSALTEKPVNRLVAMTGEVTLRGRVLPIGGLKEKLLAAQRAGVKTVLIPKANERELKEMDSPSIARLTIIPVESMEAVIKEAIADGH